MGEKYYILARSNGPNALFLHEDRIGYTTDLQEALKLYENEAKEITDSSLELVRVPESVVARHTIRMADLRGIMDEWYRRHSWLCVLSS